MALNEHFDCQVFVCVSLQPAFLCLACLLENLSAKTARSSGQHSEGLLELGIVGIGFENEIGDACGLYGAECQAARIRAVRHSTGSTGVPASINARTDVFLKADQDTAHADFVEEALVREPQPALTAFSFMD